MKITLLLFFCLSRLLLAAPIPVASDIATFAPDPTSEASDKHFKKFRVDRDDFIKILGSYYHVTRDQWLNRYSHVALCDYTGTATLKDGRILKWLVRPGGLACISFSDGTTLYLASSKPE